MTDLATRFEQDMRADSREYTRATGTNPSRYLQMIADIGAIDTARVLGANPEFHEGFTRAWESGCLDLTVEYLMLYARDGAHRPLFSDEELKTARRKLKQVGIEGPISR